MGVLGYLFGMRRNHRISRGMCPEGHGDLAMEIDQESVDYVPCPEVTGPGFDAEYSFVCTCGYRTPAKRGAFLGLYGKGPRLIIPEVRR